MSLWELGDEVPIRHKVYDYSVDPPALIAATVTVTVTAPDGTTSTPTVTTPSTGYYDALVPADQVGHWVYDGLVTGAVPDDTFSGGFDVEDPATAPPLYVDLDTFRGSVDRPDTDTSRDGYLRSCLSAASRGIDDYCGRTFWRDRAATARTYRTAGRVDDSDADGQLLIVDDIAATTGLIVEVGTGSSWTVLDATEYETSPDNAIARRRPVTGIRRISAGAWTSTGWSSYRRVRVTAVWGWPAIPAQVVQATQMQAARLYKRRSSPEGVTGNAEWGVIRLSRMDPDVRELLQPFVVQAIG